MNKRLRVLIIRNAYQKDAGGAEQYSLNLAIALKKRGHQPLLVTRVSKILRKAEGLKINHLKGLWHDTQKWDRGYYLRYPLFTLWYVYIILRYRIDIVHPQSRDDFVFATRAGKILGKTVIWTDHADLKYILDNVNHYNPRMRKWIISASKYAERIVVASKNEKQEIEAVAPDIPPLTLVYNGVFLPEGVKPVPKTNTLVVGTNARLVEAKGPSELIEGFAKLKRKDIDLWLLGGFSGNKNHYEELAVGMGIGARVKFLDYVSKPDDIVASMDIFVHSSYHEAFSLAIIEAAMLGRPIIATSVGGTPEIIDNECGILIEPKNPDAITNALSILIDNKSKRDKFGEKVKEKALEKFDFQKIVDEQIVPIYMEALAK